MEEKIVKVDVSKDGLKTRTYNYNKIWNTTEDQSMEERANKNNLKKKDWKEERIDSNKKLKTITEEEMGQKVKEVGK